MTSPQDLVRDFEIPTCSARFLLGCTAVIRRGMESTNALTSCSSLPQVFAIFLTKIVLWPNPSRL